MITHYYQFNNGACSFFLTGRSGHSPTLLPKNEISIMKHVWQNHLKNYSQNCSITFIQLEHKFGNMYCSIFLLHFCNILTIWQIILDWRKNCQKSRNVPQQIQNEMAITCRSWRVFFKIHPDSDFLSKLLAQRVSVFIGHSCGYGAICSTKY